MSALDKKTIKYLADLSRIEVKEKEEEKLLKDLREILDYFEQLKEIDTENIEPTRQPSPPPALLRNAKRAGAAQAAGGQVAGGMPFPNEAEIINKNVFREDKRSDKQQAISDRLTGTFPEKEKGYLKIPPVFE